MEIINNYVAPEYKPMLREYLSLCKKAHTQHNLALAFGMHRQFAETGSMLDTKWEYMKHITKQMPNTSG